jgi:hypothetical protein
MPTLILSPIVSGFTQYPAGVEPTTTQPATKMKPVERELHRMFAPRMSPSRPISNLKHRSKFG